MREARAATAIVLLGLVAALEDVGVSRDGGPYDDTGPISRLAGSLRDRVLDVVGPDEIVDRVDPNALLDRVDVDGLLDRVDVNRLLDRVDVDALLRRADPDVLVDRMDVDGLLDRVDVNRLLDRVDVDALLRRADPDVLVDRMDVNGLLDRVDVNALLGRVDTHRLLDRVDSNAVLDRVDADRLLARVDVDRLASRVDINALLARVDVAGVVSRVDIDAVIDRVDVRRVVERAGIPEIVAESTGSLAESLLDLLRRQLLALDVVVMRSVMRVLSRDPHTTPAGPAELAGDGGAEVMPDPDADIADVSGHYAGPVTRLLAHVLDVVLAGGSLTFTTGMLGSALRTVGVPTGWLMNSGFLVGLVVVAWFFVYWWASTAIAGRTPGMTLVGLRVVTRDGEPVSGRQAVLRVLFLPVSFALFGLGLLGIVVDRERRGLHDVIAGSTVVYDWGDRTASLPTPLAHWLDRHAEPVDRDEVRDPSRRQR